MGKRSRLRRQREDEFASDSSPLPSFQLKMKWAREHLKTLDADVADWLKRNANAVREETDAETSQQVITIEPRPTPVKLALVATDCVHSLRSALDQLVYALAWRNTNGPLSGPAVEQSEFPVFWSRRPTAAELRKRIGALHPDAQTVIEGLQPHHRGNAYPSDELWVLDQLWNTDKHRTIPLALFSNPGALIGKPGQSFTLSQATIRPAGPISCKTEVARFVIESETHVDMKDSFPLEVVLGYGTPAEGQAGVPALTGLTEYVEREIIQPLAGYLD